MDSSNDDGVGLRGLKKIISSGCILPHGFLQLNVLPLAEEHYLSIDIKLPSSGLRLCQRRFFRVLEGICDLAPPAFLGVLHRGYCCYCSGSDEYYSLPNLPKGN